MTKANIQPAQPISEQFVAEIRQIIRQAQQNAVRSVDFCRVQMYWNLGKRILEEEQQGKARAEYGAYLIKTSHNALNRNMAVVLENDNSNSAGSFIANIQL